MEENTSGMVPYRALPLRKSHCKEVSKPMEAGRVPDSPALGRNRELISETPWLDCTQLTPGHIHGVLVGSHGFTVPGVELHHEGLVASYRSSRACF